MLYLNNAGAGLLREETLAAIMNYYRLEQSVGAYQAAIDSKDIIAAFYSNIVKLINAESSDEIAFVDSASRGWNLVTYGTELTKGDDIITLSSEFGTNLITLYDIAFKTGANIHIIPCEIDGNFSISAIESVLKKSNGKKLIAISQAAAQGSIVNPVFEIGQLAREYSAIYIVDGCQSVGQMETDVQKMNCDVLITSGRKWLCGPRGTGFIYVRKGTDIQSTQLDLASTDLVFDEDGSVVSVKVRTDAKRFEIWERNIASLIGLSTAISNILSVGITTISHTLSQKADVIRQAILSNEKLQLVGKAHSLSGVVGFYTINPNDEKIVREIFKHAIINTSAMSDYDCPLFFPQNGVSSIFRISPHYFTEEEAIKAVCGAIQSI